MSRTHSRLAICSALALAIALVSCEKFRPFEPAPPAPPAPAANSPTGAIRRLAWAIAHLDAVAYNGLLSDDFRFMFAVNDSAGMPFPGGMGRPEDITALYHMLVGGGAIAPLTSASVTIDNTLIAQDDPRPGKNRRWHRSVRTNMNITFKDAQYMTSSVSGYALFFVVRGDSAIIPQDLIGTGVMPDSTRWWIERWDDQTAGATGAPGLHALPTRMTTLGDIKVRYLPAATGAR